MIFGSSPVGRHVHKRLLLLVAGTCPAIVLAAGAADSPAWDIGKLMHGLAQVRSAKATFVERKHLAILTVPLESSGTLLYVAPSRLEKHTLEPRAESLVLEREGLTIESKGRSRTLDLQDYPL